MATTFLDANARYETSYEILDDGSVDLKVRDHTTGEVSRKQHAATSQEAAEKARWDLPGDEKWG